MSIASQDYRDGAASGAAALAKRAAFLMSWGAPITAEVLESLATRIAYDMGGRVDDLFPGVQS